MNNDMETVLRYCLVDNLVVLSIDSQQYVRHYNTIQSDGKNIKISHQSYAHASLFKIHLALVENNFTIFSKSVYSLN